MFNLKCLLILLCLLFFVFVAHFSWFRLDIDITDHDGSNPHLKKTLTGSSGALLNASVQQTPKQVGQKAIAGLMVPPSTAQSYAAIAHAAAAAAQSNQQRNNSHYITQQQQQQQQQLIESNQFQTTLNQQMNQYSNNSNNNLLASASKSYNNPGFFESTSYSIVNK